MGEIPAPISFVKPTLARAAEIKSVEPIVSYFCLLHAVQQILETKLHVSDPAVAEFATDLLTEIETDKTESTGLTSEAAQEILGNEDVARAYVLNFASKVFDRAERSVQQLQVTKSTAAGFVAAATFLDLERIWSPLSPETTEKIKYAKFQAAQILRAIRARQDPNTLYEEEHQLQETSAETEPGFGHEEDQDTERWPETQSQTQVSQTPDEADFDRADVPGQDKEIHNHEENHQLDDRVGDISLNGQDLSPPSHQPTTAEPARPPQPPQPSQPTSKPTENVKPTKKGQEFVVQDILSQNQVIDAAQKHAKYAISALNFEDISTAIAELTVSLGVLKRYEQQHNHPS